ncbi:MAG: hypothetical protein J6T42_04325 [Clostridia bacterium]|nr:hypothetical protein [Clostridia bacterium]
MRRTEEIILCAVKLKCESGVSAITNSDELTSLVLKRNVDKATVERALDSLDVGGYIEKTDCIKNGEKYYLLTLTKRALNYDTEKKKGKKIVAIRLLWAVCSAFVTFAIGRLLVLLFA